MERLADAEELLDGALDDPAALIGNLRDLRRVNRWLGGVTLSATAIDAIVGYGRAGGGAAVGPGVAPITVLDVGTGGADIPVALLERATRRGSALEVTGIDSRPEILAAAVGADRRLTATAGLTLHVGDGRSLPYPDGAFDVVHTSLVIHHLAPADVAGLLHEMARVARRGVVVNDLIRGRVAYAGAWLLAHLFTTNRFTRHDGPLSVRRAYTLTELIAVIEDAGLRVVARDRGLFGHRWAIAAVRAEPPG
jgi:ubiquinone/menaquinone biosynthesis C-methylase UbiE